MITPFVQLVSTISFDTTRTKHEHKKEDKIINIKKSSRTSMKGKRLGEQICITHYKMNNIGQPACIKCIASRVDAFNDTDGQIPANQKSLLINV